jgi:hypothetical protein
VVGVASGPDNDAGWPEAARLQTPVRWFEHG